VSDALQTAENKIDDGVIVISGSVYLVGEARSLLLQQLEVKR
jgi:folylpolyglutamate synthase/dihydropteroate synthase